MENQVAPVNLIFLYFRAEIFKFSFNHRCKMHGYWGTWTGNKGGISRKNLTSGSHYLSNYLLLEKD